MLAFFIQKQLNYFGRGNYPEFPWIKLPRLSQNFTQDVVGYAACRLDDAFAHARAARLTQLMRQRFPGSLACHLKQSECRKTIHGGLDSIPRQLSFELCQYGISVIFLAHVNEIDNHNAAQITQTKLPGNRLGRFKIGFINGFIKITRTDKTSGIDINSGQRFRLVNDQVTA